MVEFFIKIEEVKFDIDRLVKELNENIEKILDDAAQKALDEALSKVPVRTGLLKSSIFLKKINEKTFELSAGGGKYKERGKPYYAPFVEFGTRKMAPRPYMLPAWEQAKKIIESCIKSLGVMK